MATTNDKTNTFSSQVILTGAQWRKAQAPTPPLLVVITGSARYSWDQKPPIKIQRNNPLRLTFINAVDEGEHLRMVCRNTQQRVDLFKGWFKFPRKTVPREKSQQMAAELRVKELEDELLESSIGDFKPQSYRSVWRKVPRNPKITKTLLRDMEVLQPAPQPPPLPLWHSEARRRKPLSARRAYAEEIVNKHYEFYHFDNLVKQILASVTRAGPTDPVALRTAIGFLLRASNDVRAVFLEKLRNLTKSSYSKQFDNVRAGLLRAIKTYASMNCSVAIRAYALAEYLYGCSSCGLNSVTEEPVDCNSQGLMKTIGETILLEGTTIVASECVIHGMKYLTKEFSRIFAPFDRVNKHFTRLMIATMWAIYDFANKVPVKMTMARFMTTLIDLAFEPEIEKYIVSVLKHTGTFVTQLFIADALEPILTSQGGPQATMTAAGNLFKCMYKIIWALLFGAAPEDEATLRICDNRIRSLSNVLQAGKTINSVIIPFIAQAINGVCEYASGHCTLQQMLQGKQSKFQSWCKDADRFTKQHNLGQIDRIVQLDPAVGQHLIRLLTNLEVLLCTEDVERIPTAMGILLRTKYVEFLNAARRVRNTMAANNSRPKPFTFVLEGPPGIGKTEMMKWVTEAMCKANGIHWTGWETASYQKSENTAFWDGYRNQPVMYYNDLFQIQTEEAITNAAIEIVKASQTSVYPLNMADVSDKGSYFFNSPLICADTNVNLSEYCETTLGKFMADPMALLRRFDVRVFVSVDPTKGITRTIGGSTTVVPDIKAKGFDPSVYIFTVNNIKYRWMDFLKVMARKWVEHRRKYATLATTNFDFTELVLDTCRYELKTGGQIDYPNDTRQFPELPEVVPTPVPASVQSLMSDIDQARRELEEDIDIALATGAADTHPLVETQGLNHFITKLAYPGYSAYAAAFEPRTPSTWQRVCAHASGYSNLMGPPSKTEKCLILILRLYRMISGSTMSEYIHDSAKIARTLKICALGATVVAALTGLYYLFRSSKGDSQSGETKTRVYRRNVDGQTKPIQVSKRVVLTVPQGQPIPDKVTIKDQTYKFIESYDDNGRIKCSYETCGSRAPHLALHLPEGYITPEIITTKTGTFQYVERILSQIPCMEWIHYKRIDEHEQQSVVAPLIHLYLPKDFIVQDFIKVKGNTYMHTKTEVSTDSAFHWFEFKLHNNPVVESQMNLPITDTTVKDRLESGELAQSNTSHNFLSALRLVKRNMCAIYVDDHYYVSGVVLCTNVLCVPDHLITYCVEHEVQNITLVFSNAHYTIPFGDFMLNNAAVPDRDYSLVALPEKYFGQSRPSILKHLATSEEIVSWDTTGNAQWVSPREIEDGVIVVSDIKIKDKGIRPRISQAGAAVTLDRCVSYYKHTVYGDCGSLVLAEINGTVKIISMHIAGSKCTSYGVGTYLKKDEIAGIMDASRFGLTVPMVRPADISINTVVVQGAQVLTDEETSPNLGIIGLVDDVMGTTLPRKTSIRKSPIYGVFPVRQAPSSLTMEAMRVGIRKMEVDIVSFDETQLQLASYSVYNNIMAMRSKYKDYPLMHILSIKEAVFGVDGDEWIRPLERKTSCGYPWTKIAKERGKDSFVDYDSKILHPLLIEAVEKRIQAYESSECVTTVFVDTLKDERRDIAKVEAKKTRVFTVAPLDFNIVMRMYTMGFQAHQMANCVEGISAVGINVHGPAWGLLWRRLMSRGPNIIAGDFEGWDKWFPYRLGMAVMDMAANFLKSDDLVRLSRKLRSMIEEAEDQGEDWLQYLPNELYQEMVHKIPGFHHEEFREYIEQTLDQIEKGDRVIKGLGKDAFNALRLCLILAYIAFHGMPSGIPGTSIFNSDGNGTLFNYAFRCLAKQSAPNVDPSGFFHYCGFTAYGDDHMVSVNDSVSEWFNMYTVSKFFNDMGIGYTTADKTYNFDEQFVPHSKVTYLKRNFVWRNGHCFAPLKREVIEEMVSWVRKGQPEDIALRDVITSALYEMCHYPKYEYCKFYTTISEACARVGVECPVIDFDEVVDKMVRGTFDESVIKLKINQVAF